MEQWDTPTGEGTEAQEAAEQGKESGRGAAAGSWTDGVKPRTPALRSRLFYHTIPLRICSRHFSAITE